MVAFSLFPGDSVVLIALLGIVGGALAGRLAGGMRVAFFLLSLGLALGFGHLLTKLSLFATMTELIGFKNPLWQLLIPRLLATLLLTLMLVAVLESVHRKIYLHYKYKYKDDLNNEGGFDTWEYLNDIWGLTLGVGSGVVCMMIFLSWLHAPGYLLLQIRPSKICERVEPWGHKLLRRICADMHVLGLGTPASKVGPAHPRYFTAADTIGYIYHNYARTNLNERNRFHQRVFHYPGIIPMLRHKEIQALESNPSFLQLWIDNTNFYQIADHTNVAPLLQATCLHNDDNSTASLGFTDSLANLNLEDYLKFLKEGRSDVYKTENPNQAAVIGTWQLAVDQTYDKFRRDHPRAQESRYLAVHRFLRKTAFRQSQTKPPVRQYDWILTFTADKEVYSQGRFFPMGPLFIKQQTNEKFSEPNINRRSSLWATGRWSALDSTQNEYTANLTIKTKPPRRIQVLISPAADHLMVRFPEFNNETYVFRRYEF